MEGHIAHAIFVEVIASILVPIIPLMVFRVMVPLVPHIKRVGYKIVFSNVLSSQLPVAIWPIHFREFIPQNGPFEPP